MPAPSNLPSKPILTTVVGSYPLPDWLAAHPTAAALEDATRVVLGIQEMVGIDVVTDGELYRFDVNDLDTNGMIDYFAARLGGVQRVVGRAHRQQFLAQPGMSFRSRPAGVVAGPVTEGTLDLVQSFQAVRSLTRKPIRFTVTGPHMLAKTLLDLHYPSRQELANAIAAELARQVSVIEADVIQLDEANLPGNPEEWKWAAEADNIILDAAPRGRAVHLCFGNYGGQSIQKGEWKNLTDYLAALHADHVLLELAHRGSFDAEALKGAAPPLRFGLGVVDIKTNVVETPEEIARRIEFWVSQLGLERIAYVNPDCGFWMLKRSVVDRKMAALVRGRDLYLGLS